MPLLINPDEDLYRLGNPDMDSTHAEFITLVNALSQVTGDDFCKGFDELVAHTQGHFDREKEMMTASDFPALNEHVGEHNRVLADLLQLQRRVQRGNLMMAKAFVKEQIPGWFHLHATTMDSALANHIKGR
ncbi:bacteriohemerythrin [Teredinibacter turnerae]|uniref:bacteriohemerythrin n=1 Tax=Teredinibacter turnerae TaxID=2426 RepID=UPI00035DE90E|nr:hemerythrin domain-containing protein [Teredinibacter turnerae]